MAFEGWTDVALQQRSDSVVGVSKSILRESGSSQRNQCQVGRQQPQLRGPLVGFSRGGGDQGGCKIDLRWPGRRTEGTQSLGPGMEFPGSHKRQHPQNRQSTRFRLCRCRDISSRPTCCAHLFVVETDSFAAFTGHPISGPLGSFFIRETSFSFLRSNCTSQAEGFKGRFLGPDPDPISGGRIQAAPPPL